MLIRTQRKNLDKKSDFADPSVFLPSKGGDEADNPYYDVGYQGSGPEANDNFVVASTSSDGGYQEDIAPTDEYVIAGNTQINTGTNTISGTAGEFHPSIYPGGYTSDPRAPVPPPATPEQRQPDVPEPSSRPRKDHSRNRPSSNVDEEGSNSNSNSNNNNNYGQQSGQEPPTDKPVRVLVNPNVPAVPSAEETKKVQDETDQQFNLGNQKKTPGAGDPNKTPGAEDPNKTPSAGGGDPNNNIWDQRLSSPQGP